MVWLKIVWIRQTLLSFEKFLQLFLFLGLFGKFFNLKNHENFPPCRIIQKFMKISHCVMTWSMSHAKSTFFVQRDNLSKCGFTWHYTHNKVNSRFEFQIFLWLFDNQIQILQKLQISQFSMSFVNLGIWLDFQFKYQFRKKTFIIDILWFFPSLKTLYLWIMTNVWWLPR